MRIFVGNINTNEIGRGMLQSIFCKYGIIIGKSIFFLIRLVHFLNTFEVDRCILQKYSVNMELLLVRNVVINVFNYFFWQYQYKCSW